MVRCSIKQQAHVELDDPYRELGLTEEASDTEVKAAWRRLSARWHPDRNPSPQALQRIQRINQALEAIRSARERAQLAQDEPTAPPTDTESSTHDDTLEHTISLSLEEAATGCTRTVQGEVVRSCTACDGTGEAPEPVECAQCAGRGATQSLWFPWMAPPMRCATCEGRGSHAAPCSCCDGSGQAAPIVYRAKLRIPAGVRDGHRLHVRVKLKGRDGLQPLDVRIRLEPHEFMSLQDDGTIRMEVPVDGIAWIAGRWVDVPTPHGMRQMRLQRGALTYRMKDAGFPVRPSGPHADCLVSVVPLFPAEWTDGQQALLDALIESNTGDEASEAGGRARAWHAQVTAWRSRQGTTAER